jgi:membrane protein DedA with SNARE-associated domain
MSVVINPGQILLPHYGISSSQRQHQSSCPWTGKISSSKYSGSSLAFARGLLWKQAVVTRVDLLPKARRQCARVADSWLDLFQMATNVGDGKP